MACYHPIDAWRSSSGDVVFHCSALGANGYGAPVPPTLQIACGQCVGCRLERSRMWAVRCLHEASLHDSNCFITLTYDDVHLPRNKSLDYSHYQLFMKRLRKRIKSKVRFYMCGEYGENFGRPHFHACIFGYDFLDKKFLKSTGSGSKLYTSELLESLWPYGFSSVGDVNFESAAYVARYIMKKITGDAADEHYSFVDPDTGELCRREPEFNHMSLKPGIGLDWWDKYKDDVFPRDYVIVRGKKCKPPKYYFNKLKESSADADAESVAEIEFQRYLKSRAGLVDNTPERLAVREQVAKAGLSLFSRQLE